MGSRKSTYSRPDAMTRAAKKAGFPARSVFKLEEIDRRAGLLRAGKHVLDLGAAPGSWALYTAGKIGGAGRLLAIDLEPLTVALPSQAEFVQGDVLAMTPGELSRFAPYDVVLSDMAPSTTGSRPTDQARSYELFMRAVELAAALGAPGGSFAGKIFMSEDLRLAREALRRLYTSQRLIRPAGTRTVSTEIFVVATGKRP